MEHPKAISYSLSMIPIPGSITLKFPRILYTAQPYKKKVMIIAFLVQQDFIQMKIIQNVLNVQMDIFLLKILVIVQNVKKVYIQLKDILFALNA